MGFITHIALACGFLAWTGFSGFARADTVQNVQQQLVEVQSGILDQNIRADIKAQCSAQKAKDYMAINYINERLSHEIDRYNRLNQRYPYSIPSCDEIGAQ